MLERSNALLPFSQATGILDNGCGPGPIMSRILKDYGTTIPASATLTCADFSAPMLEQVQQTKATETAADPTSPWSRMSIQCLNAMDLDTIPDGSVSHITAGLVYFIPPDPQQCLRESLRVLTANGVLACSSWKGSQWMDIMNLAPTLRPVPNWPVNPPEWATAAGVHGELVKAGFRDVEAVEVPVDMTFDSHEQLNDLLVMKMPHMKAALKDFSPEEMERLKALTMKEQKRLAPTPPYTLTGVALVAVGRK